MKEEKFIEIMMQTAKANWNSNYKLKDDELVKKDGEIVCLDCYKLEIKSHI